MKNNIENRVMSSGHNPVSGLKCVCMCVCVRACVHACVRACVRVCVRACLNARNIVHTMGELRLMVDDVEPDIIGITEKWTRPDMGNAEFSLRRGGGVALYIKQSIQAYEFQIDNVVDYDEAIWCNILSRGAKQV